MSIHFKCHGCGQDLEVDEEFGGQHAHCPACGAELAIPLPEAEAPQKLRIPELQPPPPEPPPAEPPLPDVLPECPHCGAELKSAKAVICVNCGYDLAHKMNVNTARRLGKAKRFGMIVLFAALAAVASGLIWAGIAIGLEMEFGCVAWLIGGITGGTIRLLTEERSFRTGLAAVALALAALLLGKTLIIEYVVRKHWDKNGKEAVVSAFSPEKNAKLTAALYMETYLCRKGTLKYPDEEIIALHRKKTPYDDPKYKEALARYRQRADANRKEAAKQFDNIMMAEKQQMMREYEDRIYAGFLLQEMIKSGEIKLESAQEDEGKNDAGENETAELQIRIIIARWQQRTALDKAVAKYDRMSEGAKSEFRRNIKTKMEKALPTSSQLGIIARILFFLFSFRLFDLLWFFLALSTAWGLATRGGMGE